MPNEIQSSNVKNIFGTLDLGLDLKFGFWNLGLLVFILFYGCQYQPPHAAGKDTEIITICQDSTYKLIEDELKSSLERVIYTPTTEYIFSITQIPPSKFNIHKFRKNILVIGKVGEGFIDSLLAEEAKQEKQRGNYIFGETDLFVRGQALLIIATPEEITLKRVIIENRDLIFNFFGNGVRKRLKYSLYKDGAQFLGLRGKYGFSISVPKGWIIKEDKDGFLSFMRHRPDRIISIYWQDKPYSEIDKQKAIEMRNKIARRYFESDYVNHELTRFYKVKFHNRVAYKLDGVWQNDKRVMGGPFRSYIFNTEERFYFIDMHMYAPGVKKWYYLQQLEIICDTFVE